MSMENESSIVLLVCLILLPSSAGNEQSDLFSAPIGSAAYIEVQAALDFRSLSLQAGQIYDLIEWDENHILWRYPGTEDRAYFSANGRAMVTSEKNFNQSQKQILDRELAELLDTLDQAGAMLSRSTRQSSLQSAIYFAGSGEIEGTRALSQLHDKFNPPPAQENRSVSIFNQTFPGGIISINTSSFPLINIKLFINTFCARSGGIKSSDFSIVEENLTKPINKRCYNCPESAISKMDLAILFDDTLSMKYEIDSLKENIDNLTARIRSANIDCRYYLATFKEDVSPKKSEWTSNSTAFQEEVSRLKASDGTPVLPENSLGAIEKALASGFRPDALKVIVVVTNEPSHQLGDGSKHSTHSYYQVKNNLSQAGVLLLAISPDFSDPTLNCDVPRKDWHKYVDLRVLANATGGLWINVEDVDLSLIYDQIKDVIRGTYLIGYFSPHKELNTERRILITVDSPSCDGARGTALVTYLSPP
jgi:hypothetical protein